LCQRHRSATQWRCEAGELTLVCHQGRRSPTPICFLGYLAERQGPGEEGRIECRHRDLRLLADHSYPLVETINHERMPVLLAREEGFETWLTGPPDEAFSLAQQYPPDRMRIVQEAFYKEDWEGFPEPAEARNRLGVAVRAPCWALQGNHFPKKERAAGNRRP